jgi:hypothetical protein
MTTTRFPSSAFLFFLLVVACSSTAWAQQQWCEPQCHCIPDDLATPGECPDLGNRKYVSYYREESPAVGGIDDDFAALEADPDHLPTLNPEGCQPYPDVRDMIGGEKCEKPASSDHVCAFKYKKGSKKSGSKKSEHKKDSHKSAHKGNTYELKQYPDIQAADKAKRAEVTHEGACGVCSSAQDLAVNMNPNVAIRSVLCGRTFSSQLAGNVNDPDYLAGIFADETVPCFEDIGFTPDCAYLWASNSVNSVIYGCTTACESWLAPCLSNPPNQQFCNLRLAQAMDPDCTLNECLQCDDDASGTIFELYAGRTRRKSGIITTFDASGMGLGPYVGLKRPCSSIADIEQIIPSS